MFRKPGLLPTVARRGRAYRRLPAPLLWMALAGLVVIGKICFFPSAPPSPSSAAETAEDALRVAAAAVGAKIELAAGAPPGEMCIGTDGEPRPVQHVALLVSGPANQLIWQDQAGPLVEPADPACPPVVDVFLALQGAASAAGTGAAGPPPYAAGTTPEGLEAFFRGLGARKVKVVWPSDDELAKALEDVRGPLLSGEAIGPIGEVTAARLKGQPVPGRKASPKNDRTFLNNVEKFYLRHVAFNAAQAAAADAGRPYDGVAYTPQDNLFFRPLPEAKLPLELEGIAAAGGGEAPAPAPAVLPHLVVDINCMVMDKEGQFPVYQDNVYLANQPGAAVLFEATYQGFIEQMWWYAEWAEDNHLGSAGFLGFLFELQKAQHLVVTQEALHRASVRYVGGRKCSPVRTWRCSPDLKGQEDIKPCEGLKP